MVPTERRMFLEKIEIFGFKALPYRVSVKFGPGITAIVGPNGCGKSNFSDAIRWVLGEQSVRQLRGHTMEDVIFNGTAARKPLGMAEVFLTFSNAQQHVPIDYDTITVGRRLYRSGQSEYLLNKTACRLRDVRDLLLDTGIGSSGYAMIAREMVEAVLSDDSGQRRMLLEEAAGIAKYKARKREALAKLRTTESDLVRVADIVTEIEREVRSLERQVGKARRYRNHLERIRHLDLAVSRTRIHALAARRDELGPTVAAGRAELEGVRARLTAAEAELENHRLVDHELESALTEVREALERHDRALAEWDGEVKVLRERRAATERRLAEARDEMGRLASRRQSILEAQSAAQALVGQLEREHEEGGVSAQRADRALRDAERQWKAQREQLAERQQLKLDLVEDQVESRARAQQAAERRTALAALLAGHQRQLDAARRELEARSAAEAKARDELAQLAEQAAETTEHAQAAEARVIELTKRLTASDERGRQLTERLAVDESRLGLLHDLKRRYEGYAAGVQTLLGDGRPDGVLGTVSELIHVPDQLMEAAEAALEGMVGTIVSRDRRDTARHLDRLRDTSGGRATFLSLDALSPPEGGASLPWDADDILGLASELVAPHSPAHRPLIEYLLGDVVIVRDRAAAERLLDDPRAACYRLVTIDGELWTPRGAVTGGRVGSNAGSVLGREHEIEALDAEVNQLQAELGSWRDAHAQLTAEQRAATEHRDALAVRGAAEREALFELEKTCQAAQLAHAAQLQAIAERQQTIADVESEHQTLDTETQALTAAMDSVQLRSDDFEAGFVELTGQVVLHEEVRDAAQAAAAEARLKLTELSGRLSESQAEIERLDAEKRAIVADEERRRLEIATGAEEIEQLTGRVLGLDAQLSQGKLERQSKVAATRSRQKSYQEARAASAQLEADARELRREADEATANLHGAELELERIRGDIESTAVRIREEYEVELLETRETLAEDQSEEDAARQLTELRDRMRRLGPVNLLAIEQYDEVKERFDFLSGQRDDLTKARTELLEAIERINRSASELFRETFDTVRANFKDVFSTLFEGGEAELQLHGDELDGLVEIMARPRGKKLKSVSLMSGGERALTAISLLFAIYLAKPSPFCIMDEVDAPLDDSNVDRFVNLLRKFGERTQFIVITHNKKTMAAAERLYGVTMEEPGVSKLVSVALDQGELRPAADGSTAAADGFAATDKTATTDGSAPAAGGSDVPTPPTYTTDGDPPPADPLAGPSTELNAAQLVQEIEAEALIAAPADPEDSAAVAVDAPPATEGALESS